MSRKLKDQWTACVLKLDQPEDGILPYKAYARNDGGRKPVYVLNATMRWADDAAMEARALADAYNRNAITRRMCDDRLPADKLPAGKFLTPEELAKEPRQTPQEKEEAFRKWFLSQIEPK